MLWKIRKFDYVLTLFPKKEPKWHIHRQKLATIIFGKEYQFANIMFLLSICFPSIIIVYIYTPLAVYPCSNNTSFTPTFNVRGNLLTSCPLLFLTKIYAL